MSRALFSILGVFLAVGVLAGCATPPTPALRDYSRAFDEAHASAALVLDDYAEALREAPVAGNPGSGSGDALRFPTSFDVADALGEAGPVPSEVAARRAALDLVADYNRLLVRLAEGRPVWDRPGELGLLREQAAGLLPLIDATLGATFGPAADLVFGALRDLVQEAERARSRAEFTRVFLAGQPYVLQIVDLLIEDVPDLYLVQVARVGDARGEAVGAAREVVDAMDAVARARTLPPSDSPLASRRAAVEADVNRIRRRMVPDLADIALPSWIEADPGGARAYDDATQFQLELLRDELARKADAYEAQIARTNAYHAMLTEYVRMLDGVRRSLVTLRTAVEAPRDPVVETAEIVAVGLRLRDRAEALRSELAGLRPAGGPER